MLGRSGNKPLNRKLCAAWPTSRGGEVGATPTDRRRKGDLEKLSIARRLRAETTMTLSWIAQRLKMGAAGSIANCLRAELK
jgi:hypothetical protein